MNHNEFIVFFLKIKKQSLAPLTINSYEKCLKKYLPLSENIDNLDLFQAQEIMFNMEHLSKATQRRNLTILREYYNYALKYKKTSYNPFCDVEKPKTQKTDVRTYAYNNQDLKKLVSAFRKLPLFWKLFFIMSIDTGARRGEITALRWENIDLNTKTVIIKNSAYSLNKITNLKETKGKKERIIHISPETTTLLKKFLLEQKRNALKQGTSLSDFVFTIKNRLINPSSATHAWKRFIKKNNLCNHRLHDLRHTTATMLLSNGVDVNTVRLRLGHTDLKTTMLYIHSNEDLTAATVISNVFQDILKSY